MINYPRQRPHTDQNLPDEPGALVGFAGPRVIKETIKKTLPKGFQSAESMLKHGFIDIIAERSRLKPEISKILDYCSCDNSS